MPPRRRIENEEMGEEMRQLRMRLDDMETTQRRAPDAGDISEEKNEDLEEGGVVEGEPPEEPLLRYVSRIGTREKIEVPMYEGNLEV
jgi:hypothetical protein